MSANKQLVILSHLCDVAAALETVGAPHTIETLGRSSLEGLPLRRLTFGDRVMLECVHRDSDVDVDDELASYTFPRDKEPARWRLEVLDDEDPGDERLGAPVSELVANAPTAPAAVRLEREELVRAILLVSARRWLDCFSEHPANGSLVLAWSVIAGDLERRAPGAMDHCREVGEAIMLELDLEPAAELGGSSS